MQWTLLIFWHSTHLGTVWSSHLLINPIMWQEMHIHIPYTDALELEYKSENLSVISQGFPPVFGSVEKPPQLVFLALLWGHCQATNLGFPVRLPSIFGNDSELLASRLLRYDWNRLLCASQLVWKGRVSLKCGWKWRHPNHSRLDCLSMACSLILSLIRS